MSITTAAAQTTNFYDASGRRVGQLDHDRQDDEFLER
jgi:YD repeat-containing protein